MLIHTKSFKHLEVLSGLRLGQTYDILVYSLTKGVVAINTIAEHSSVACNSKCLRSLGLPLLDVDMV
jgi:ribosomal protein L30/L7E